MQMEEKENDDNDNNNKGSSNLNTYSARAEYCSGRFHLLPFAPNLGKISPSRGLESPEVCVRCQLATSQTGNFQVW